MILAVVYSVLIILWPSKFICKIFQLYSFDNPEDSYYDERRKDFEDEEKGGEGEEEEGGTSDDEEEEDIGFTKEEYYSFKNTTIKYYVLALVVLNFVVSLILVFL